MKRSLLVVLVVGCGDVSATKKDAAVTTDTSGPIDTATDTNTGPDAYVARCDPSKPFGTPTVLGSNVNSSADDVTPFITPNELELWFASTRAGGQGGADIYYATRALPSADFGQAALVAGVNSTGDETRPTLTADLLAIYIEYKANSGAQYRITSSTRGSTSAAFGTPTEVTAFTINTYDDAEQVLPDHSAVIFQSSGNLYRSARVGGSFQTPALVDGTNLNDGSNDYSFTMPGEKKMYFMSGRSGGTGTDNWVVTRASVANAYGAAVNVTELNTTEGLYIFSVTSDDCIAYLHGPNGGNATDLFVAKKPL